MTGHDAAFAELDRSRRLAWAKYYETRRRLVWAWVFAAEAGWAMRWGRDAQLGSLIHAASRALHRELGGTREEGLILNDRDEDAYCEARLDAQEEARRDWKWPQHRQGFNGWPTVDGKCM